jgi:hypothetical protein
MQKELSDGRVLEIMPLTFGRARIIILPERDSVEVLDGW